MNEKKKNKVITIIAVLIIVSSFVIATSVLYVYVLKPQNAYNAAVELYESGNYKDARVEFEKLDSFKDSAKMLENCEKELKAREITTNDRAYSAYYDVVNKALEDFGKPTASPDLFNADYDTFEVKGVCLAKLIDFNNDGVDELVLAHNMSGTQMGYDVYAFIDDAATKVVDNQTIEYRAQDCGYMSIEFYKENDITYLYSWDSTCALDSGYLKSFDGKQFNAYKTWHSDEDKCYVDDNEVKDDVYLDSFPHYYIDTYKGQLDPSAVENYHYENDGMDVYVIYFLAKDAANNLVNDVNSNIDKLEQSKIKLDSANK